MSEAPEEKLSPTKLAEAAEVSVPYASQLLSGARKPSLTMALKIFRATGRRMGVIDGATEDEIDVLERYAGAA